ncbi:hypothetical protein ASPACDRAFT_37826 [Aspergillus aculeatus ATCC 16872]|uniref:Zn(2)-C6 fungal-type domain-containing protein n=1 Tax=Aspergillus aculeatus (strain ATCC 16872 / CBS 172.66 / WB 5094) TaxID=690307 RepID=A0A1L9X765_ASPA1|nr:uncharacterized protein ASPACDRAFT_37826 [Aspergillus aculeatus ATCC 16872]OJK04272.1 hypothetical protein ASPACDRAFT_37826 [Aspergillus aculeatus ATCC 16872]
MDCDETKPECSNCVNHSVRCIYDSPAPKTKKPVTLPAQTHKTENKVQVQFVEFNFLHVQPAPAPVPATPAPADNKTPALTLSRPTEPDFCLEDFEPQHFYVCSTAASLTEDPGSAEFWQTLVPRASFLSPLVHHLMLALACLHMTRTAPVQNRDDNGRCLARFEHHYATGLRLLTRGLPDISVGGDVIWIGSILLCFIGLARGPQANEFLFFDRGADAGPIEWLALLHGVDTVSTLLSKGRASPEDQQQQPTKPSPTLGSGCRPPPRAIPHTITQQFRESLSQIRQWIEKQSAAADPLLPTYRNAIDHTLQAFASLCPTSDGNADQNTTPAAAASSDRKPFGFVLFTWVTRLEQPFWEALQRKQPVALMLVAHFAALMRWMDGTWVSVGWPEHILRGAWMFLEEEERGLVRWLIDDVGVLGLSG